jgi:hypothetical protein
LNFTEIDYVDNTVRFQTQKLLAKLFYLPRRLMRVNEIAYPYWENAVRAQEIRLGILALLRLLFLLIPLGIFGISIALLLKKEYSNCKAFLRRKCADGLETLNRRLAERREKRKKEEE